MTSKRRVIVLIQFDIRAGFFLTWQFCCDPIVNLELQSLFYGLLYKSLCFEMAFFPDSRQDSKDLHQYNLDIHCLRSLVKSMFISHVPFSKIPHIFRAVGHAKYSQSVLVDMTYVV